jgi:hypothetical protein
VTVEQFNLALQKHGLALYDFGASVTTMPLPNFETGHYLHSSVIYVIKPIDANNLKMMGIEIPGTGPDFQLSDERVSQAVNVFEYLATVIPKDSHTLPQWVLRWTTT